MEPGSSLSQLRCAEERVVIPHNFIVSGSLKSGVTIVCRWEELCWRRSAFHVVRELQRRNMVVFTKLTGQSSASVCTS